MKFYNSFMYIVYCNNLKYTQLILSPTLSVVDPASRDWTDAILTLLNVIIYRSESTPCTPLSAAEGERAVVKWYRGESELDVVLSGSTLHS